MDKSQYLKPREYEMLAVLVPDQGEEETQSAIDALQGYITDKNGTIDSIYTDSPWGRRRLAYTVRHQGVDYRDGHYVLTYFTVMPSEISEIERDLKLDNNLIRYLLLIHDPEMGEKIDEAALAAEQAEAEAAEAAQQAEATESTATEEAAPAEATAEEEAPAEAEAETAATEEEAPAAEAAEETPAEEDQTEEVAEEAPAEEAEAEKSEESDEA